MLRLIEEGATPSVSTAFRIEPARAVSLKARNNE
jgi:hypothetical protein